MLFVCAASSELSSSRHSPLLSSSLLLGTAGSLCCGGCFRTDNSLWTEHFLSSVMLSAVKIDFQSVCVVHVNKQPFDKWWLYLFCKHSCGSPVVERTEAWWNRDICWAFFRVNAAFPNVFVCAAFGIQLYHLLLKILNHRVAWVEKDHNDYPVSPPLLCAGLPSTRPGCPEPHPAWPWMPPGM